MKTLRFTLAAALMLTAPLAIAGPGHDHSSHAKSTAAADTKAMDRLMQGNARFTSGAASRPNQHDARRAEVAKGQAPFAVVVSCSDSRVPPEVVFDQGLGDLFKVSALEQEASR